MDFPNCNMCGEPGVMSVNGFGACEVHIDDVMAKVFLAPQQALRIVYRKDEEP